MQKLNHMPRKTRRRRLVYLFTVLILGIYILLKVFPDSIKSIWPFSNSDEPARPFNHLIRQDGEYLPFFGYKVVQLVTPDESYDLTSMREFLQAHSELQEYFKLVPYYTYHITLTNLKNQTRFNEDQVSLLIKEQNSLDQDETSVVCHTKKGLYIEQNEIRLPVEVNNAQYLNSLRNHQRRWDQNFGDLIVEQFSNFYITLAHQYKPIRSKNVKNHMKEILDKWDTYPFEIPLDPIEFFSYTDAVTYSALLPDIDMDSYELFYSTG